MVMIMFFFRFREKFWDDVVTIWTDDSPESSALTMSLFIDLYQTLGYTVSDYMPEKMKGWVSVHDCCTNEPGHEKTNKCGFLNRFDTNQAVQTLKQEP